MQRPHHILGLGALVGLLAVGTPAALSAQDTSAGQRDTVAQPREGATTKSKARTGKTSRTERRRAPAGTARTDSAADSAAGYEAGRAAEGQESGEIGEAQSGVTPNRAGLPGDSARPHPDAEPLRHDVTRVETDSGAVETAPNPPGVQSPPPGDSSDLRGRTPSGEAAQDSAAPDTSRTGSSGVTRPESR